MLWLVHTSLLELSSRLSPDFLATRLIRAQQVGAAYPQQSAGDSHSVPRLGSYRIPDADRVVPAEHSPHGSSALVPTGSPGSERPHFGRAKDSAAPLRTRPGAALNEPLLPAFPQPQAASSPLHSGQRPTTQPIGIVLKKRLPSKSRSVQQSAGVPRPAWPAPRAGSCTARLAPTGVLG